MDASYLEVGTEVIVWHPHLACGKPRLHGYHGTIQLVEAHSLWGDRCRITGAMTYWWYPDELILTSDEPLLKPKDI